VIVRRSLLPAPRRLSAALISRFWRFVYWYFADGEVQLPLAHEVFPGRSSRLSARAPRSMTDCWTLACSVARIAVLTSASRALPAQETT